MACKMLVHKGPRRRIAIARAQAHGQLIVIIRNHSPRSPDMASIPPESVWGARTTAAPHLRQRLIAGPTSASTAMKAQEAFYRRALRCFRAPSTPAAPADMRVIVTSAAL